MKTIKKWTLWWVLALAGLGGCDKFSLLKDEDMPDTPAGENLKSLSVWQYLKEGNYHADDLTGLSDYARAIERAGLSDLLDAPGDYTIILPNSTAIDGLLIKMGYASLEDVPIPALRNLLLGNMFSSRVRSYELSLDVSNAYPALNGDSIYVKRTDPYVLTINDVSKLSSLPATVRTQNLEFNNAVVHVVTVFPYYALKTSTPDAPPTDLPVENDTVYVQKDAYVTYGTNANKTYNTATEVYAKLNSNATSTRRSFLQFPVRDASFSGKIGSVKLFLYCHRIDGAATINIYEDANQDWEENNLTANNAPAVGTAIMGSFTVAVGATNRWYSPDITAGYLQALESGEEFMNIGVMTPDNQLIGFRPKEYSEGIYQAFFQLSSPPENILGPGQDDPLQVDNSRGSAIVGLENLSLTGASDKNILYALKTAPEHGYVTVNGLPLTVNGTFSQEQVANGVVKYLHDAEATQPSDQFELEAKDNRGAYYPDILRVTVTIR